MIQRVGMRGLKRADHVWKQTGRTYKCVLCGGVTHQLPPAYPTPEDWTPERYEPLTHAERALCPFDY